MYHDDEVIFGPALNRAYQLEVSGGPPRIILDPEIEVFRRVSIEGVSQDGDVLFLDAFLISHFVRSCGAHIPTESYTGLELYTHVVHLVRDEMNRAIDERVRAKFKWLYDRMCVQIKQMT